MEFFDLYGKHIGEFIAWLSKPETNIPAIKLIQATAALLGAIISVLGFYKAWKFAEKRLGKRLDEFLENEEAKIVSARRSLQDAHRRIAVEQPDPAALFSKRSMKAVLKPLGATIFSSSKAALSDALARTEEREQLARKKSALHLKQKAMTHLLLGAVASAEKDHQKALVHFQSALEIDEHDVEALEYLGFQYLNLGDGIQALSVFAKLVGIARARGDALLASKALRDCGLAYEKFPTPRYFNASVAYRDAINEFPNDGPAFEFAHMHELRGQANIQQRRPRLAHACLTRALTGYSALEHGSHGDTAAARAGVKRVIEALEALKLQTTAHNAQAVDDEGDDGNGVVPADALSGNQTTQQQPNGVGPN